jgi:hypothetical protein
LETYGNGRTSWMYHWLYGKQCGIVMMESLKTLLWLPRMRDSTRQPSPVASVITQPHSCWLLCIGPSAGHRATLLKKMDSKTHGISSSISLKWLWQCTDIGLEYFSVPHIIGTSILSYASKLCESVSRSICKHSVNSTTQLWYTVYLINTSPPNIC